MAAFEILHQWIPLAQENISLEAALGNLSVDEPGSENSIQLPLELLSILMEAPSARELEESSILKRSMPVELRGYLLTWVLIFDHFEKAVGFPTTPSYHVI